MTDPMDRLIYDGTTPPDPGPGYALPPEGHSYYGDARRDGLAHAAAVNRAAREMGSALASIAAVQRARGQANLPAVLAGLVLAVGLMLAVGWVEEHAAAGARLLARASTAVANLIESP